MSVSGGVCTTLHSHYVFIYSLSHYIETYLLEFSITHDADGLLYPVVPGENEYLCAF